MLERFDGSDGLAAIFPAMLNSLIALKALGYADDHPQVLRAEKKLKELEHETADSVRIAKIRADSIELAEAAKLNPANQKKKGGKRVARAGVVQATALLTSFQQVDHLPVEVGQERIPPRAELHADVAAGAQDRARA